MIKYFVIIILSVKISNKLSCVTSNFWYTETIIFWQRNDLCQKCVSNYEFFFLEFFPSKVLRKQCRKFWFELDLFDILLYHAWLEETLRGGEENDQNISKSEMIIIRDLRRKSLKDRTLRSHERTQPTLFRGS